MHPERARLQTPGILTLAVVWAVLALLFVVPARIAAATVAPVAAATIGADPGQHLAFIERTTFANTESLNQDANSTSASSSSYDVTKTATGYSATATMLSTKFTMGGSAVAYPSAEALINIPIVISLDAKAKAVDVQGIDKALAAIKARVGDKQFAQLEALLTPGGLKQQAIDGWNTTYGLFAGFTAQVGKTYTIDKTLTIPSGAVMPVKATLTVLSLTTVKSRSCAVLSAKYSLASPDLLKAFQAFYSQADMAVSSVSVEFTGKYTVDLANGLTYDTAEKQTTRMKFTSGGSKPKEAVTTETTNRAVELR